MYLDPSEGKAGAFLDTVYGAATSGALQVDPHTGEATLKFLNDIQELTGRLSQQVRRVGVTTPLGGGFGEEIGAFNRRLGAGGSNDAQELLARFGAELEQLKNAVAASMKSYQAMDGANAHALSKLP